MITTPADEPVVAPWRGVPVEEVVTALLSAAGSPAGRPVIVAVDGRAGSGKSTVADVLARAMGRCVIVHTDDVAWWESFFGWDSLMAAGILGPVRAGAAVRYRPPAWTARAREGAIEVPAGTSVVIVEGVGASRRSLGHLVDARVWVQSDYAEARRRGVERDGDDEAAADFWDAWTAEEEPFLGDDRPWERADLVVCGTPELADVPRSDGELLIGTPSDERPRPTG
jgi:hypothetical protein